MGSFTVASTSSNECISRHFRFANSRRPLSSQRVRKTAHSHYPRGLTDPRTPTNRANHLQALRNHRSSLGNNSVAQKTNSGSTNFTDAPRVRRCPVHNQKEPMRRNLIVAAVIAACLALPGIADAMLYTVEATSYCEHGLMADGGQTKPGVAAVLPSGLPLGSKIKLTRKVFGRKTFFIRDHIDHGSQLDLWNSSCSKAVLFGRRNVTYRVIKRGK